VTFAFQKSLNATLAELFMLLLAFCCWRSLENSKSTQHRLSPSAHTHSPPAALASAATSHTQTHALARLFPRQARGKVRFGSSAGTTTVRSVSTNTLRIRRAKLSAPSAATLCANGKQKQKPCMCSGDCLTLSTHPDLLVCLCTWRSSITELGNSLHRHIGCVSRERTLAVCQESAHWLCVKREIEREKRVSLQEGAACTAATSAAVLPPVQYATCQRVLARDNLLEH